MVLNKLVLLVDPTMRINSRIHSEKLLCTPENSLPSLQEHEPVCSTVLWTNTIHMWQVHIKLTICGRPGYEPGPDFQPRRGSSYIALVYPDSIDSLLPLLMGVQMLCRYTTAGSFFRCFVRRKRFIHWAWAAHNQLPEHNSYIFRHPSWCPDINICTRCSTYLPNIQSSPSRFCHCQRSRKIRRCTNTSWPNQPLAPNNRYCKL